MYENMSAFANKCFFVSFIFIALTGVAMSFVTEAAFFTLGVAFVASVMGCGVVVLKHLGFIDESF